MTRPQIPPSRFPGRRRQEALLRKEREEREAAEDLKAAKASIAEGGKDIPWDDLKKELDL